MTRLAAVCRLPLVRVAGLLASAAVLTGFGPVRPPAAGFASLGSADALAAAGSGAAALYANPASMIQLRQNTIEFGVTRAPLDGRTPLYVTSVDATSGWGIAGGIGYSYDTDWTLSKGTRGGTDLRLGLAAAMEGDSARVMVGASARRMDTTTEDPSGNRRDVAGWTGDAGVTIALGGLRLAGVVRNGLELDPVEAPRRVVAGIALVQQTFLIEGDGSWGLEDGAQPAVRVGAAWQPSDEGLQLRAGYAFDDADASRRSRHWVTAGLAWNTASIGLGAAAAFDVEQAQDFTATVGFVWQVPFDL